ncbi:MAG: cation transporter [Hyphomicrobium sp.]|nr:cation transporter [Hyphomicrobium sp.]
MGSGHDHDHGTSTASATALTRALVLTGGFLIVEVIAGILTNSLALLSDAAHMLTDTAGIAIALAAIKIGERPADSRRTFGYRRFEILAAALNSILLFLAAAYILYEAWRRLIEPSEIDSLPMLAVAFTGLLVNIAAMRILAPGKDVSLNVKGAYLEVWSDMLGSVGVMLAAIVIYLTEWTWVDAVVAVGIGLWVVPRTWKLFSETMNVLLEGVPDGIDLEAVATDLRTTPGVADIHDLHVWALTSNQPSLSVHIVLSDGADADVTRNAAAERLADRFHIEHVTIQTEKFDCRDGNEHHGLH